MPSRSDSCTAEPKKPSMPCVPLEHHRRVRGALEPLAREVEVELLAARARAPRSARPAARSRRGRPQRESVSEPRSSRASSLRREPFEHGVSLRPWSGTWTSRDTNESCSSGREAIVVVAGIVGGQHAIVHDAHARLDEEVVERLDGHRAREHALPARAIAAHVHVQHHALAAVALAATSKKSRVRLSMLPG
jgi:hypothetical protein